MIGRDPALTERLRAASLRRGDRCGACGRCGDCGAFATPLDGLVDSGGSSLFGKTPARGLDASIRSGIDMRPWRPPTLKRDGAAFKPTAAAKDVPVGALVAWREWTTRHGGTLSERVEVTRRGQVWSGCPKSPGAVWVAPEDGGPGVALSKTLDVLA